MDEDRADRIVLADTRRRLAQEQCLHPKNALVDLGWGYRCRVCGKINP